MHIDLNADVGEGLEAADRAILPLVSSANIACGGHAGDARSMALTVELAIRHHVGIGAHPAYPDREGFGRREIDIPREELRQSLVSQVQALAEQARSRGHRMRHVKPHGALYNRAAADRRMADLVADAVRSVDAEATLVGLAGSELLEAGRAAGLTVAVEGFADRAYEPDGSLRPRNRPGAVLEGAASVAAQALAIARDGRAPLDGGGWVDIDAETLCLHSDSPGAVANAEAIHTMLDEAGVIVRMMATGAPEPVPLPAVRIVPFGERAFLVEFDAGIDEAVNDHVHDLAAVIEPRTRELGGDGPLVEGYASLLVSFDPDLADPDTVAALLESLTHPPLEVATERRAPTLHEIPVRYGEAGGPDLEHVARCTGLGVEGAIEAHSAPAYRVFMLGFAPGFGYLGPLPEALRLPRRAEPRLRVPAGSVAVAGAQTAVYPHQTAGGWHILGHTDLRLWDPRAERPALLRPGDRVRFVRA